MVAGKDLSKGFSLGTYTVLPDRGQIVGPGEPQHVEPKVMDVLLRLAEARGELVTKQELVDSAWGGRPVTDEVIARCISAIRGHLGDDHKSPRYLETVPKRGYRLLPEVVALGDGRNAAGRSVRALAVAGAVLLLGVTVAWWVLKSGADRDDVAPIESIAVLPFTNMSADDMQYLADGLTEELTYALAQTRDLKVAARTTAFRFRDTALDVREIGELIDVDGIIEGSVRREDGRLRVTAQLIDARSGYHLWAASFDGSVDDIFRLQRQVAERVRRSILSGDEPVTMRATTAPSSFPAYDLYLRGRHALNLRGLESLERAISLFRQCIELDPDFGPAYLELANALLLLPSYGSDYTEASYDDALRVIERGVAADRTIARAAAAVSGYIANKRGEWLVADHAFRTALQAPQASSTTHQWYSNLLGNVGRLEDAVAQARTARRLDPLSPVVVSRLAMTLLWTDDDDAAAQLFATANELGIRSALHVESYLLLLIRQRDFGEARRVAAIAYDGELPGWLDDLLDCLAGKRGCDAAADSVAAARLEPRVRLISWALLDRTERVEAVAELLVRDIGAFETELLFIRELADFRRLPSFTALTEAIGLAAYWTDTGCQMTSGRVDCGD